MKTSQAMTTLLAVCALAWAVQAEASAPSVPEADTEAIPTDAAQLRGLIADLDRRMFQAYNAHDVDGLMAMFAEDLEFYHDTGGLLDFQQVKAGFTNVFANNKDIRRDLVPGSLEVYPIHGHGAIEIGAHRFCHTENGEADCGTFRFMQIWRFKDGAWKVSRDVSYGH
jgi:ketosteroid isomerase-like protein